MWYEIEMTTGEISGGEWNWKEDLPKNYLGSFIYEKGNYELKETGFPSKEEVYRFKDPK